MQHDYAETPHPARLIQADLYGGASNFPTTSGGLIVAESGTGAARHVVLGIHKRDGQYIGVHLGDDQFDQLCELIAPIVERRNAELEFGPGAGAIN